jgi:hypothetical protein
LQLLNLLLYFKVCFGHWVNRFAIKSDVYTPMPMTMRLVQPLVLRGRYAALGGRGINRDIVNRSIDRRVAMWSRKSIHVKAA